MRIRSNSQFWTVPRKTCVNTMAWTRMIVTNTVRQYPVWFFCFEWQKWNENIRTGKSFFTPKMEKKLSCIQLMKKRSFLKVWICRHSGSRVLMGSKIGAIGWSIIKKRQLGLAFRAWLSSWCSRPRTWAGLDQSNYFSLWSLELKQSWCKNQIPPELYSSP